MARLRSVPNYLHQFIIFRVEQVFQRELLVITFGRLICVEDISVGLDELLRETFPHTNDMLQLDFVGTLSMLVLSPLMHCCHKRWTFFIQNNQKNSTNMHFIGLTQV